MKAAKSLPISKQMVWQAYRKVKANQGSAGIDGESMEQFEENLSNNLYKLWNRMASGSYFPPSIKGVPIPKKNGKFRMLGIPTVSDRIAQMVLKDYLEPKIDPNFHSSSFGYRPGKSAHQALEQARTNCWKMYWVIDLDIQGFFDEIDHGLLRKALERHTQEKWVLMYVERWIKAPMVNSDGDVMQREKGVPQGSVLGPLLANLFLHYAFDKWMEREYPSVAFERYADDSIVHCLTESQARFILDKIRRRMKECRLQLHPEKTRIVYCKQSGRKEAYSQTVFDFLGYTFKPRKCRRLNGNLFQGYGPAASIRAKKSINDKIRGLTLHRRSGHTLEEIARLINPTVRGWINYFGKYRKSELRGVFYRLDHRLIKWVQRKYKRFKTSKRKALHWLKVKCKENPTLFAHWEAGFKLSD